MLETKHVLEQMNSNFKSFWNRDIGTPNDVTWTSSFFHMTIS